MRIGKLSIGIIISSIFNTVYAAPLETNATSDIGSDGIADGIILIDTGLGPEYQGDFSGGTTYGIRSNNTNFNGNPWNIKTNSNINVSDNVTYGIYTTGANAKIEINANTGGLSLFANNILNATGTNGFGIASATAGSTIGINGFRTIDINGNFRGITTVANSSISFTGDGDTVSKISISNNLAHGINSAGTIDISGFKTVDINGNNIGIHTAATSNTSISGTPGTESLLSVANNNSYGMNILGTMTISGFKEININDNQNNGIYATGAANNISISGDTESKLSINNNNGFGISSTGLVNLAEFREIQVTGNQNTGMQFTAAADVTLKGDGGLWSKLSVTNNKGYGLQSLGAISISGFQEIDISDNQTNAGLHMVGGTITGATTIKLNNNIGATGDGLTASTKEVTIDRVQNMYAIGNGRSGIFATAGSILKINMVGNGVIDVSGNNQTSTTGGGLYTSGATSVMEINGGANTSLVSNGGGGTGIFAYQGTITVNNMQSISLDGNLSGAVVNASHFLTLDGAGATNSTLTANNNSSYGIRALGTMTITDFAEIETNNNGATGFTIQGDSTISTIAGQTLSIKSNNNAGSTSDGFYVSATGLTLDRLSTFQASGNGRDGVSIAPNGSLTLDMMGNTLGIGDYLISGNGRHGIYNNKGTLILDDIGGLVLKNNDGTGLISASTTNELEINGISSGITLEFSENGGDGVKLTGTSTFNNVTSIIARNNDGTGVNIAGDFTWNVAPGSEIRLVAEDNAYSGMQLGSTFGLVLDNIREFTFNRNSQFSPTNSGTGFIISKNSYLTVVDTNASACDNGSIGIYIPNSANIDFTSSTGLNTIEIVNNGKKDIDGVSMGIDLHGGTATMHNMANIRVGGSKQGIIAWYVTAALNVTDSNMEIFDNGSGIMAGRGDISISSSTGAHTITGYRNNVALLISENAQYLGALDFSITNMNINLYENKMGIASNFGGGDMIITGDGTNTLSLVNNTDYGMFTQWGHKRPFAETDVYALSNITVDNMQITSIGNIFAATESAVQDGAEIIIKNSTIAVDANYVALQTVNYGTFNFENVTLTGADILLHSISKQLIVSEDNTDPGNIITTYSNNGVSVLSATGSELHGAIISDADAITNVTFNGTTWHMKSSSNMMNLENMESSVYLGNTTNGAFNTLTVKDYAAINSQMHFNTYFDMAGNNTDRLVIDGGTATGNTMLFVNAVGTDGIENRGDGIKLIDFINGASNNAGFQLYGDKVDSGAYEYLLFRGSVDGTDTESMFLRTNWQATSVSDTIESTPLIDINLVKTGMNHLRKRLGELRNDYDDNRHGVWARAFGKHMDINTQIDVNMNIFGVEAGYDYKLLNTMSNKIYVGGMFGYMTSANIKIDQPNSKTGHGDANVPSVGLYATWLHRDGWFIDLTGRYFMTNLDISNTTLQNTTVEYAPDRNFIATSAEFGKKFQSEISETAMFTLEPKLEFGYAYTNAKKIKTNLNGAIEYGNTQSLTISPRLNIGYKKNLADDKTIEPFIEFGISQEMLGKTNLTYDSVPLSRDISGTTYNATIGIHSRLGKRLHGYADIDYEDGTSYRGYGFNIGLRYTFGCYNCNQYERYYGRYDASDESRDKIKLDTDEYHFYTNSIIAGKKFKGYLLDANQHYEDYNWYITGNGELKENDAENLSQRRAENIREFLEKNGVPSDRIQTSSNTPVETNTKTESRKARTLDIVLF